ncbi:MAG: AAA family ATPase [Bdellovibrionales bacterium]|nr:AAA family ATPase [Bdellovibrionales bacterium]
MTTKLIAKKAAALTDRLPEDRWLIDELIPANSLCIVAADPKAGKSFLAISIAAALTTGHMALRRYRVPRKRPVLILDGEDQESEIKARIRGAIHYHFEQLSADIPIHVISGQHLTLDTLEARAELRAVIAEVRPALVVIDPLARFLGNLSENASSAMADLVGYLRGLQIEFNCSVLLLHHLSKAAKGQGGGSSLRGSGFLNSAYDCLITLKRHEHALLMSTHFKNHPSTDDIPLSFYVTESGMVCMGVEDGAYLGLADAETPPRRH